MPKMAAMPADSRSTVPDWAAVRALFDQLAGFAVDGKAYSLLAFLFGLGMGIGIPLPDEKKGAPDTR